MSERLCAFSCRPWTELLNIGSHFNCIIKSSRKKLRLRGIDFFFPSSGSWGTISWVLIQPFTNTVIFRLSEYWGNLNPFYQLFLHSWWIRLILKRAGNNPMYHCKSGSFSQWHLLESPFKPTSIHKTSVTNYKHLLLEHSISVNLGFYLSNMPNNLLFQV